MWQMMVHSVGQLRTERDGDRERVIKLAVQQKTNDYDDNGALIAY